MPSTAGDIRLTVAWQKLRRAIRDDAKRRDLPCAYCHRPIDYTLSGRDRWGPHVDHIDPLWLGGTELPHPSRLQVMHHRCNVARGNRMRAHRPPAPSYTDPRW